MLKASKTCPWLAAPSPYLRSTYGAKWAFVEGGLEGKPKRS